MFSLAESLVQTRSTRTPQLGFTPYHNHVGRIEPLQPVLAAPLYWLAVRSDRLGNVQTVLLFNVLITAATGALLYTLLLNLDHPPGRAALVALIHGLATIAWPYSRSFFREPLLALLLTLAAYSLSRWQRARSIGWGVLTLLCLLLALITKVTSFLAWSAFGLTFVLEEGIPKRARLGRLLALAVIGLAGGTIVDALYRMRQQVGILRGLRFPMWNELWLLLPRLFGLTWGSGRGLFLYSPVLVLALPGLALLWRRQRTVAILCLSLLVSFLLGYSSYGMWHGGLVWGSRLLIPIIPLLLLPVAEWLAHARRAHRMLAGVLVIASFAVQIAASTTDYTAQINARPWAEIVNYGQSPAVQQVASWRPGKLDLLWWHSLPADPPGRMVLDWRMALLLAVTLLGAVALLVFVARRRVMPGVCPGQSPPKQWWLPGVLLTVLLAASTWILSVRAQEAMIGYPGTDLDQLRLVAGIVNQDRGAPHVIVTVSNEFQLSPLLNLLKGRFVHHWLSPVQTGQFEALLAPPFKAQSLRLIVDRVHMQPDHPEHSAEMWLNARLYRYFAQWVGDAYEVYSYLYPPDDLTLETADYTWAPGMTLSAYGMTPDRVARGEPFWLEFHFSATQPPKANYDVFVQLLAPDGDFVNGTDGAPQFGAAPTTGWIPGETVVDRRACFVPGDAPPGQYRVIAGFYRGGERATVFDDAGRDVGTHVELGTIAVRQP